MSQENVEIVRRMYDAFNAGDYQTSLNLMSPDIEYHELAGMPGAGQGVGVYHGHEELAQWYSEFLSQWESLESVPGEITELEADLVLVVETWRARGASSGVDVERTAFALYTIAEGQITSLRYFSTKAEALEAAGLRE
jgi:uncharacterized protein